MASERSTATFTAEELEAAHRRGESRSDWARVRAMTDAEAAVPSDAEDAGLIVDWAAVVVPDRKQAMTIRLDRDVLDFYRNMGRGYQTKINAVLRAYMEHLQG